MTFIWLWGKTGIPQFSPKSLPLSPPQTLGIFGEFIPENPQEFSSSNPRIFPEESKNTFPVPTLSPNFGDGEGDFRGMGTRLASLVYSTEKFNNLMNISTYRTRAINNRGLYSGKTFWPLVCGYYSREVTIQEKLFCTGYFLQLIIKFSENLTRHKMESVSKLY